MVSAGNKAKMPFVGQPYHNSNSSSSSSHEENWLNRCPIEFKPNFYRRYVDDIFVLFESPESAHSFCEYVF